MIKKERLFFFVFLLLIFSLSFISASKAAYIYRKNYKVDSNVIGILEDRGLDVDLILEKNIPYTDFDNYKLIYVGDERFIDPTKIPIDKLPSIVSNYYHGDIFGLTDSDGISMLAANSPLSVKKGNSVLQVYTSALDRKRIAIPYYYLDDENKAPQMMTAARTYTGDGNSYNFGDVVSYANAGTRLMNGKTTQGKLCFFGLVESDYWTNNAKQLFNDCLGFVAVECSSDSECLGSEGELSCNNGDVYQDVIIGTCENPGTVDSSCEYNSDKILVEECSDECLDGSCVDIECHNDNECDDSDSYTKDTCENPGTTSSFCSHEDIQCIENSDCGSDGFTGDEFCSGDNLLKKYLVNTCENPGTVESECTTNLEQRLFQDCEYTCYNDSCTDTPIECFNDSDCNDSNSYTKDTCENPGTPQSKCTYEDISCLSASDCGTDGFIGSDFCSTNNLFRNYKTFDCKFPGSVLSYCVSSTNAQLVEDCSDICENGSCVDITCSYNSDCNDSDSNTEDICNNAGTVDSYCTNEPIVCRTNSDCGINSYTGDFYCDSNSVFRDFQSNTCYNGGTSESYCSSSVEQILQQNCIDSCYLGSCITITCNTDLDCDDSNSYTKDVCQNPGTANSTCSHGDITCQNDLDCGVDMFLGSSYCVNTTTKRDFLSYSCENAGTTSSYCSSGINVNSLDSCEYACSNGECIRCNKDLDCDDNDINTEDICWFKGTSESYCTHETIICSDDSDCGVEGYSGQPFCIGEDLYQNYREFSCSNAGTTGSYCSYENDNHLIEECDFGCAGAECLSGLHNIMIDALLPDSVNGIKIKDSNGTPVFGDLVMGKEYKVNFETKNVGDFTENITFDVDSDCFSWTPTKRDNLGSGASTSRTSPWLEFNCSGSQSITIQAILSGELDNTPLNNIVTRNFNVASSVCSSDSDCGAGIYVGDYFCSGDNITRNYSGKVCINPGESDAYCSDLTTTKLIGVCAVGCSDGVCIACQ